ncbi:MAG: hypothetical protein E7407_05990 [Ruminococcaceae bacterium]|nr:hypothetical protein [Oscillospiraceae bacterium]
MIILLKKRSLLFISLSLVFCAILSAFLFPKASPATAKKPETIVIDAGHGEPDGGAVSISGHIESSLNLDVALKLCDYLKKNGFNIIMTRENENGIFDENAKTTKEKKVSDMHSREKIMNTSGADLFVSIHMNKFEIAKYSGPQVFYSPHIEKSEAIAESIQQMLISDLKPQMEREIKKSDGGIYLLKKAQIPAVLIECGFLSNPDEEKLLLSDDYRKKMAESIGKGIIKYLKNG